MIAVITLCSIGRLEHVRRQQRGLASGSAALERFVVWLDETPPPPLADGDDLSGAALLHVPPGDSGMRLAAARNAGASAAIAAGAELLIFLDADCIAGPDLVALYSAAARTAPDALLCGPVTYLPEGVIPADDAGLVSATAPHSARPSPAPGTLVEASADDYPLFWSLSFAATPAAWNRIGGFAEDYQGYGGEDTDFAFTARDRGVPLIWVGGAHAYHQHHPTSMPPWQHLDDIIRNGALFAGRWGTWPMEGWLALFEDEGAVRRTPGGWARIESTRSPDLVIRGTAGDPEQSGVPAPQQ